MKRKNMLNVQHVRTGLYYTLVFIAVYLVVALFEGSCTHPVLNNIFLFSTAPFNPLENCLAEYEGIPIINAVIGNFVIVAVLIFIAGYYFSYLRGLSKKMPHMLDIMLASVITTYIASAASWAYLISMHSNRMVATGTSLIGFDMCMFLAVFMAIEYAYNFGMIKRAFENSLGAMSRSSFVDYIKAIGYPVIILALLMIMYGYMKTSLIHVAGLIAFPIFIVILLTARHTGFGALVKSFKYNRRRK